MKTQQCGFRTGPTQTKLDASVVQWLCHSPCKPGVTGSIPGFSSPLDGKTEVLSPYDLSCWWDVKTPINQQTKQYKQRLERFDLKRTGIVPGELYYSAKLSCAFVFAYAKCWFSHDVVHFISRLTNLHSDTLRDLAPLP